jgi:hypothetical protein
LQLLSLDGARPKPLFKIAGRAGTFDASSNGQRTLSLTPTADDATESMTVVVNCVQRRIGRVLARGVGSVTVLSRVARVMIAPTVASLRLERER